MANDKLTKEQEERLDEYHDKWLKIGLSTEPINEERVKAAVKLVYECAGLEQPKLGVVFVGSPFEAIDYMKDKHNEVPSTSDFFWGQHEASSMGFYEFFRDVIGVEGLERINGLIEAAKECGWCLFYDELAVVCSRLSRLEMDEQERLHSMDGPAAAYPNGDALYAVHGVRVPRYVIEEPEKITVQDIESEDNAEVRRVKTEQYGLGKYLQDSGATLIDDDLKPDPDPDAPEGKMVGFGRLWTKTVQGDETITMVEVQNSTREPDGHWKTYFLRVPPNIRDAHSAIAWTFGKTKKEYNPMYES